jgi:DNA polymerase (family X)
VLVIEPADPRALVTALIELPVVESVDSSGEAGGRITTYAGMKVDLKVVEPDQFGNVLQHFTGSKEHNVALREQAVKRGLSVSEYGVQNVETGELFQTRDEAELYEHLGYQYIPPVLRENRARPPG